VLFTKNNPNQTYTVRLLENPNSLVYRPKPTYTVHLQENLSSSVSEGQKKKLKLLSL